MAVSWWGAVGYILSISKSEHFGANNSTLLNQRVLINSYSHKSCKEAYNQNDVTSAMMGLCLLAFDSAVDVVDT